MNRYMVPDLALEAQVDRRCPRCGGTRSRIHERREHRPRDPWVSQVSKIRMRCVCCGKTWTLAPSGLVLHAQRSDRVKVLNVLLYALGLSYRGVSAAMCAFRVIEDKMTVYRDVQLAGSKALARLHRMKRRVSLAGIDGTGQRLAKPRDAHSEDLVFVVDFGDGRLLEAALVDEQDSTAIGELIKDLEKRFGVARWVSDEHGSYAQIPWGNHELCTAHFVKNKRRRLREIEGDLGSVGEPQRRRLDMSIEILRRLLDSRRDEDKLHAHRLYENWAKARAPTKGEKASPDYKMQQLALEVWNNWDRVWNYTNNATERKIGATLKVRSKTMRGFKVAQNIPRFVALSESLFRPTDQPVSLPQFV